LGVGADVTVKELAETIKDVVGFNGSIHWDVVRPDGTPQKLLDVSALDRLGWKAKTAFTDGLRRTYDWYLNNSV
jgi:GDP-L-fucose synthase